MDNVLNYRQLSEDYQRIEQAIHYLDEHYQRQPDLGEVASAVGLSEYHFQRLFTQWAGISPKRFLQFITKENAKQALAHSSNVLDAAYRVGLSSPGRLHDLMISTEAVTPGEYKTRGAGIEIRYGFHATPFGEGLIGVTDRGICHLGFVETDHGSALENLRQHWTRATLIDDVRLTKAFIDPIFALGESSAKIHLFLSGTNFQIKVWEALLKIPFGAVTTYAGLAAHIGSPKAVRAVGSAVGKNPVAVLIPCHRVIRTMGGFGQYRYGLPRKKALLGWEMARSEA